MLIIGYVYGGSGTEKEFEESLDAFKRFDKSPAGRNILGGECKVRGLYVADSRNQVCRRFLDATYPDGTKPQWLLFIDSDIVFTPQQVYDLIDAADPVTRAVLGGLYFGYIDGEPTPVWRKLYTEGPNAGQWGTMNTIEIGCVQPIEAVGMGFTLIHRNVLNAFPDINDDWKWFGHDIWPGTSKRLGEDLTFCNRAAKYGHPTWGHSGIVVGHIKKFTIDLKHFTEAWERKNGKQV